VKTYKARGGRYAGGDRKTRTGLTKWFGEEWVDLSRPTADGGYEPCGRKRTDAPFDAAHYPKCRPLKEALRMTPDQVADAVRRKRRAEASAPARGSRARAPKRVATYRKNPAKKNELSEAWWSYFSKHLPEVLSRDEVVACAGEDGDWFHGDCGLLAYALREWEGGKKSSVWAVRSPYGLEHALLRHKSADGTVRWIDASGVSTTTDAAFDLVRRTQRDPSLACRMVNHEKLDDYGEIDPQYDNQGCLADALREALGEWGVLPVRANPEGIDGDALAAWCASDESYAVLDETASAGSSWMAGACVLLAKALVATHPEAQLVGLEVDGDVQHVGALVGDVVYDALGAHDERTWARDWLAYEQLDPRTPARLVSLPPGVPASALPDAEAPATARDVRLVARALPA
jgi:hypothetical protein